MGWKDRYKSSGSGGGGGDGLFLRFKDKDAVEFIVPPDAEPHQRYQRFDEKSGKYEKMDGPGEGVQARILMPVFVVSRRSGSGAASAVNDMKILEMAPSTFADLCSALDHERVGGTDQIYELRREGEKMATRWKVARIDRATDAQLRSVRGTDIPDLGRFGDPIPESGETTPAPGTGAPRDGEPLPDDGIPF